MNKAAIIGWPVDHSRSPLIYQTWLKAHGIAGSYERIAVKPGDVAAFMSDFARGANGRGLTGFNVTIPHKVDVLRLAEEPDETARLIGAANLVWRDGTTVRCTNTDGAGFMAHLTATVPAWRDGRSHVLLLGAGGAARSLLYGFIAAGVDAITVVNRHAEPAERLVRDMAAAARRHRVAVRTLPWDDASSALAVASVIVNATSLGMKGVGRIDLDLARARSDTTVADIVYVPLETEFLGRARAHGLKIVDGLGMLLHQAVPAFERFWGVRPAVTSQLRARLEADIEGR